MIVLSFYISREQEEQRKKRKDIEDDCPDDDEVELFNSYKYSERV